MNELIDGLEPFKILINPHPGDPSEKQIGGNHYKSFQIQPAEFCQRNQLNFLESNAIKYLTRHRLKNGKQDLQKAIHCIELILEYEYD
jgi:hypothetical protein